MEICANGCIRKSDTHKALGQFHRLCFNRVLTPFFTGMGRALSRALSLALARPLPRGGRGGIQRREEFWSRKTPISSFSRVGIAPRVSPRMDARGDAHAVKQFKNPSRRWV
ncbi:hypothetical protein LF1_29780 [Rubripirellula obstinata]|uniref:Uncharacterized protein n=1 Tax=Rubripirellula obstinata TaxID=406547 RepID=A0A5B1CGW4_9BACT|nr:hypothetical protein LF1_29780 [Rubripirellula obstinata]